MVRARCSEGGEPVATRTAHEIENDPGVVVVTDLAGIGARESSQQGEDRCGTRPPLVRWQGLVSLQHKTERLGSPVTCQEVGRGADDLERGLLALVACRAPGGYPVAAEDHADGIGVFPLHLGDIEAELETGPSPGDPDHAVAEAVLCQLLALFRCGERDPCVGMEVVDVRAADEAVHGGVDRGRRASPAVQAEVEGSDHVVFVLGPLVDADEGKQPVEAKHGQARGGKCSQVAAGPLHPQQLDLLARYWVKLERFAGSVSAGIIGVAGVGTQSLRAFQQLPDGGGGLGCHDSVAPTDSSATGSLDPHQVSVPRSRHTHQAGQGPSPCPHAPQRAMGARPC